ncbi:hypothetical protein JVT61DRAFT_2928 [Boletus reticuloceps]|uniref:Uncharacterized protein n=1 Tax=Boletus reticuloceps TaxID=495285 RepID=A0A8I2YQV6_9AGAM|nr:hypothetical protein JVT61DRAFT_2928 [Boletus reticuloceps]
MDNRLEAGPKTKNIPGGSLHQSFPSEDEANRAFEAALARGEVRAYPDAGMQEKSAGKSKNVPPSPLGGEVSSLLRLPLDLKVEVESQTPLSSSARLRVAKLRQTLRDSPTESCSPSSSPPTGVTVYAPLYDDDPPDGPAARPSPHFTFTSSSSRTYPIVTDERVFETGIQRMPLQLEVSDWDSPPSTPSSSDSYPGAEEHTPKSTRCMPLHLDSPSKNKGVKYASLTDLADMQSVDSRVWLPKPRIFDPDKVKPRPLTRPPSPVKRDTSFVPSVDSSSPLRREPPFMDSSLVRTDRGRHSRLTPSASLPIFLDRELEDKHLGCGSRSTQLLENHRTGKGKERELDYSVRDECLVKRPTRYPPSSRNDGRSHVQLVPRDGRDERSTIVIHCPPKCPHYTSPPAVSAIEPSLSTGSRYVDACVSPIITRTSRIQSTDSPTKSPSKRPRVNLDGDGFAVFTHVPHQGIAPEADVRSPISKGTMVPMIAE